MHMIGHTSQGKDVGMLTAKICQRRAHHLRFMLVMVVARLLDRGGTTRTPPLGSISIRPRYEATPAAHSTLSSRSAKEGVRRAAACTAADRSTRPLSDASQNGWRQRKYTSTRKDDAIREMDGFPVSISRLEVYLGEMQPLPLVGYRSNRSIISWLSIKSAPVCRFVCMHMTGNSSEGVALVHFGR